MTGTRAAARYAKAMLEISSEKGTTDAVKNDMVFITESIAQSEELRLFLSNPIIKGGLKLTAIQEVFSSVTEETKHLFALLMQNKRFEILEAIAVKFQELYDLQRGIEQVVVISAVPLDEALESKVMSKVKELTDKEVVINNEVDPEILGGFILRIGDKQYNASLANKLQLVKRELIN